jgi:predicted RNA-binding Zn-ribbon protein involved in translation (DUF1610 family)
MADAPPPLPTPTEPPEHREPALTNAPPEGKLFPCVQCGAKVEFHARSRSLKCPYCGHETPIEGPGDGEEVVERDFDEYLRKVECGTGETIAGRSSQVRCTGCGAMVLLEDRVVTENCPFCGTHLENQPESAGGMLPPESLIPFAIDLRAARGAFDQWLHSLWFAPTRLKLIALLGQLTRRLHPVLDLRRDDLHPLQRHAGRQLHRHRDVHRPRRPGQHGDQDPHRHPHPLDPRFRRGAALLRRRAGVRLEERAGPPRPRVGAVEAPRAGAVQGRVPRRVEDRALRGGAEGRAGHRQATDGADHRLADPPGHRRRPPADLGQAHPLPGGHVQALPVAGVGGQLPLPREAVPDPDQRAHRQGGRRAAVELLEDPAAGGPDPLRSRRDCGAGDDGPEAGRCAGGAAGPVGAGGAAQRRKRLPPPLAA